MAPHPHKLRLVRTTRPPNGDLEVVGFAFNTCPTRDETASWLLDSYFGFVPKTYSPSYRRGTHKNICKQYRARQHKANPSLVEWEGGHPYGVDWHEQMSGLSSRFGLAFRCLVLFWFSRGCFGFVLTLALGF